MPQQKPLDSLKLEANLRKNGRSDEKGLDELIPKITLFVIYDEGVARFVFSITLVCHYSFIAL